MIQLANVAPQKNDEPEQQTNPQKADTAMTTPKTSDQGADAVAPTPAVETAMEGANTVIQRGIDAVQGGSQRLRDGAFRVNEQTLRYVQTEPLKAMLIAAATGAALVVLARLMTRPSRTR